MTKVQITLPDALAQEAESAGLLAPEVFANWVREQLRARNSEQLFALVERMSAIPDPNAMSPEEVAEEVKRIRAKRRAEDAAA
jgi:hypothetical protein